MCFSVKIAKTFKSIPCREHLCAIFLTSFVTVFPKWSFSEKFSLIWHFYGDSFLLKLRNVQCIISGTQLNVYIKVYGTHIQNPAKHHGTFIENS